MKSEIHNQSVVSELKNSDLFFLTKSQEFNITELELHRDRKRDWNNTCLRAAARPDRHIKHVQMFSSLLGFKKGLKILDVGCGTAPKLIELSYLGASCTGLDLEDNATRLISAVSNQFALDINVIKGNACLLPFSNETFDVVMSSQFFEHVTDIDLALKEQIRVLKVGGRLFIEQGNFSSPLVLFDLLVKYPIRTKK